MSEPETLPVEAVPGGVRFRVKVQARARREGIAGVVGGALRLRVNAPPLEGRANKQVISLLAKGLQVRRAFVKITAGQRTSLKTVVVEGLTPREVVGRIGLPGKTTVEGRKKAAPSVD